MTLFLPENELVMSQKYPTKLSVGNSVVIVIFSIKWRRVLGRRTPASSLLSGASKTARVRCSPLLYTYCRRFLHINSTPQERLQSLAVTLRDFLNFN
jgi:hypothetical protein